MWYIQYLHYETRWKEESPSIRQVPLNVTDFNDKEGAKKAAEAARREGKMGLPVNFYPRECRLVWIEPDVVWDEDGVF